MITLIHKILWGSDPEARAQDRHWGRLMTAWGWLCFLCLTPVVGDMMALYWHPEEGPVMPWWDWAGNAQACVILSLIVVAVSAVLGLMALIDTIAAARRNKI